MKRKVLFLTIALAVAVCSANVERVLSSVPLQVGIIDPTLPTNPIPKSPIQVPVVSYEDNVLAFDSSCVGATVQLVQNGTVILSCIVPTTLQLALPTSLSGNYLMELYPDDCSYYFCGYVTL